MTAQPAKPRIVGAGFTLIELMLAVAVLAVLVSIALPMYGDYREKIRVRTATQEIATMQATIAQYEVNNRSLPPDLAAVGLGGKADPWGTEYQYFDHTGVRGNGAFRRDKGLNPINTDYDLYSKGKDKDSKDRLDDKLSVDDVVRARNGAYIGLSSEF